MTATTDVGASSTTISLGKDLKARVMVAAAEAGVTLDAFVREAIVEKLSFSGDDEAFRQLAEERWAEFERTGLAVSWEDTEAWLQARARGEAPPRPVPRKIDR